MKTKCKCNICGFENSGNSRWQTERDMWEHIKSNHDAIFRQSNAEKKDILAKIDELQETIPVLYSTEQQGKATRGSWTI